MVIIEIEMQVIQDVQNISFHKVLQDSYSNNLVRMFFQALTSTLATKAKMGSSAGV